MEVFIIKRRNGLFSQITDLENIKLAILKSSLGKREQRRVRRVLEDMDTYAMRIQELLINKKYKASDYIVKTIQDESNNKQRVIHKPRYFPDQIIHWALMLVLEKVIIKGMYEYSCGSVPRRGTSFGQKTVRRWMDTNRKHTKYCLKMDISKFYPSVDNELLKEAFRMKIKDRDCLWLIDEIIDSATGLPIGNYTSQWFSNFFLQGLDHHIKEKLGAKYYIRYVDDLVIFGNNKKKLHKMRVEIDRYLHSLNLKMKGSWQVFKTASQPVDFLGLRFYPTRTTLRRRNALRIMRRVRKIKKKGRLSEKDASAIVSYWGWLLRSDSYQFYHKHVKPVVSITDAKRTVSNHARIRNRQKRDAARQQPTRTRV